MTQLAIELGKQSEEKKAAALKAEEQLKQVPEILSKVAQKYTALAPEIIEKLKECRSFFMVGAGGNYATADESALGFSQSSGRPAQAFQLENFLHGPIQTLRKGIGVVLIAAPGPFQERLLKTAQACKIIGAKVVLLYPEDLELPADFDVCMDFPSGISELLSPLVYMTPLWQLAYYFSLLGEGSHTDRLSMDKPEFKEAFAVIMAGDKKFVK
jgi:glucosamine 6-phosphate synthetase-like amidotransferase/phosphosugar isomerase protein